jgi:HEAT repeat protein
MPFANRWILSFPLVLVLNAGWPGLAHSAKDESQETDEKLLRENGVVPDGPGLLTFFRKRSLTPQDRENLQKLVRQLGARNYRQRARASLELVGRGEPVLPLLRPAVQADDREIAQRASHCIAKIERGPGPGLPAAAARLLVDRRPPGAADVLLNFLPYADDESLEEEVLICIGRLALAAGKVDPVLTTALADRHAVRRGAAAYVLGRMGGIAQRSAVRRCLADPDAAVRRRAAYGLAGKDVFRSAADTAGTDEALCREQKISTDAAGLLAYFRKRTLSKEDQARLNETVGRLRSSVYKVRKKAAVELGQLGPTALPFLRPVLNDADQEVQRLARWCVTKIENGPGASLPTAAAHLVLLRHPPQALETLLGYVPFADDEAVEDAVLQVMCALGAREAKTPVVLFRALQDQWPARRAAAAFVLARVGTPADCQAAHRLLHDYDPRVRLTTAQGFLAAKDPSAVPVLVELLRDGATPEFNARVEETLGQVAGADAPVVAAADTFRQRRQTAHDAWAAWYRARKGRLDLVNVDRRETYLGLRVICEFGINGKFNGGGGKVWECGRDGKERWKIEGLLGPMDAQVLPNGHVLVAENHGRRVTERDKRGKITWQKDLNANPVACQRLPNGNTFIACYYNFMEVRRDGTEVYNHTRPPNNYIFSASMKRNGNVVLMTSTGNVEEVVPKSNKQVHVVQVQNLGNWSGAQGLRNGNYLVALMAHGKVMEVDAKGAVRWECPVPGVHTATRLPNGNTLVATMNNRLVAEYDRAKREVWKLTTAGQPWRVRYR